MTSTTFDPTSTATSLATAYTSARQTLLKKQVADVTATGAALDKLKAGLDAFDTALAALRPATGASPAANASVLAHSATVSDASVATASAGPTAVPGRYGFFVEQLATAGQRVVDSLGGLATPPAGGGMLTLRLGGATAFSVDLAGADVDHDGLLSPAEIAMAVNGASGNSGRIGASVITAGGQPQLLLTAGQTGAASAITLDTSALAAGPLATALSAGRDLVTARDAVLWLGAQGSGVAITQASNTFDGIAGLHLTFTRAMATGDAPVSVVVASDDAATTHRLQAFVDAANTLHGLLADLTATGDARTGKAAAAFAHDSAVRSLQSRLASALRQSVGGATLASYGITADRQGVLSLDATKLSAKLATDASGLDALLAGTTTGGPTGVLATLHATIDAWTDGGQGQIQKRRDGVSRLQSTLDARQAALDDQYNSAYARYLSQFTRLQTLQSQMGRTSDLFTALFSSGSNEGTG